MVDPRTELDGRRRQLLRGVMTGAVAAVAGCLGGGESFEPVTIPDDAECDYCSMQVSRHPGPVGEAFYGADAPETLTDRDDGIARFCSSKCMYNFRFEQREADYEPAVSYGTDYSSVDWSLREEEGTTVISAHLEAAAFADVTDFTFVVDSGVEGAMGASLVGFSEAADAESFADEHGGTLLEDGEITREVVAGLGR